MKSLKLFALMFLLIGGCLTAFGQKKVVAPIKPKDFKGLGMTADYKVLVQGNHSKVETPFVFVARDETAYAQLKNLVEELPEVSTIDFKKNAVIAGFAGERSTGGWSVEIKKTNDGKSEIFFQSPGKGMMTTQVITTPFKVWLVPVEQEESLKLNAPAEILSKAKSFVVNQGDFEFSGGFAGIKRNFKADGTIKVISFGDYATVLFDLKGKGKDAKRTLSEMASGTLKDRNISLSRLDAGTFVDRPNPPFSVNGKLNDKKLTLKFESAYPSVADGFTGSGDLEAVKIKK